MSKLWIQTPLPLSRVVPHSSAPNFRFVSISRDQALCLALLLWRASSFASAAVIYVGKVYKWIMFFEFFLHLDGMPVGLSNHRLWNIGLIQLLCAGEWRWAVFIPGQKNQYKYSLRLVIVISHSTLAASWSAVCVWCCCFDVWMVTLHVWQTWRGKRLSGSVTVRQPCLTTRGFYNPAVHLHYTVGWRLCLQV